MKITKNTSKYCVPSWKRRFVRLMKMWQLQAIFESKSMKYFWNRSEINEMSSLKVWFLPRVEHFKSTCAYYTLSKAHRKTGSVRCKYWYFRIYLTIWMQKYKIHSKQGDKDKFLKMLSLGQKTSLTLLFLSEMFHPQLSIFASHRTSFTMCPR